jgi:Xaa-Pro aminopeptidase
MIHPGFATSEYERRVQGLQERMRERGLTGALLTAEANYNYFAGYHHFAPWTTFCRPVFLAVPAEAGAEPALLVHAFPAADAKRDAWFDDVRSYDTLTYAPLLEVLSMCKELGMDRGPVGMELGAEHRLGLTAAEFDDLRGQLQPAQVADVGDLIWDLRIRKSEPEIALHKESGRIAAAAFQRCFERVRPGMTEADATRILGEAIAQEGGRVGFFIVTSGKGYFDRVAGLPRDRALEADDFLWIDLGVVYRGYWTDHCRATVLGQANDGQRDNWEAITTLTRATVAQLRPGQTAAEVVSFIEEEGRRMGLSFSFAAGRSGHGIGLMSTEPPHIALYDHTVLGEGMAFSIEPGWIDQDLGVFVAEENVVLSHAGADMLTVTPRALVEH